ncbi:hypothetical protein [Ruminococcus albus]|uniref:hypothetical protein n=1 Tax=Ruminococcus albus TaxID=1264 RepID=UPI000463B660|nr:hypothetical protein [Ruminococcus albus]
MIFHSKNLVQGVSEWELNTDTQTVRHVNPSTGEQERYVFHADHIRYHLHYVEEEKPERLQKLVDEGKIYRYLDELDTKVTDALNDQTELFMTLSVDYRVALATGDLNRVGAIGNMLRLEAQEAVFASMVYA